MTQNHLLLVEGLLNLTGAAGVLTFLFVLMFNRKKSLLESRLIILLSLVGALFFFRGIAYSHDLDVKLTKLFLFPSSLFPLGVVLFGEGLLRRHFPLWCKIICGVGSVIMSVLVLYLDQRSNTFYIFFVANQLLAIGVAAWQIWFRNQSEHSPEENRLINGISVVTLFVLPLIITDYRQIFNWDIMRLGSLGGLVFVLACVKFMEKRSKREFIRELVVVAVEDIFAAIVLCLVWDKWQEFWTAFVVIFSLHLLFVSVQQIALSTSNKIRGDILDLVKRIEMANAQGPQAIAKILLDENIILVSQAELASYDTSLIKNVFTHIGPGLALEDLKRSQFCKKDESKSCEQLSYLLEVNNMNVAYRLSEEPLTLVLAYFPNLGVRSDFDREMELLLTVLRISDREGVRLR